jgi:hypothetical protein
VKSLGPLLAAGSSFAAAVGLGLAGGIVLSNRSHQPGWVLGGLFAGLLAGGYLLVRLLLRGA